MFPASMPDSGLVPSARPRTRSDRASQQGSGPHPGRLELAVLGECRIRDAEGSLPCLTIDVDGVSMAPGVEREDRDVSNCLVHVHRQPEDRADSRGCTDIASGTRLGKLTFGHEPDMRGAEHASSLEKVEAIICVEDHECAPTVVGHDADRLGERRRVTCSARAVSRAVNVVGCSWSSYSTPFSSSQSSKPRCGPVRTASSPLIANLQSASRVGLQATATPAAATPQNDTPQARAPEPSVARGIRCAGGPIALEIVSDCGQPVSSEPWLAFPSGLEAAIRSEVR
jgi:hypothetical protein